MADYDVTVVFDVKNKSTKTKPGAVWIKIYEKSTRKRKYVSTGVSVLPSEWNDKWWVVKREDCLVLNNMIKAQKEKCESTIKDAIANDDETPNSRMMKVEKDEAAFENFVKSQIDKSELADGTRKHHLSMYNLLLEFGKMMRFEDVTRKNLEDWIEWIKTRNAVKLVDGKRVIGKITQSTVHDHWKRLRKYIRIAQQKKLIPISVTHNFNVSHGQAKERVYLTDYEIEAIMSVDLPNEHLKMARDRFLVQMGTGLSYADLVSLDFGNHTEVDGMKVIQGRRVKTGVSYFVVILPFAVEVLERWEWDVPTISNVNYNIYLDELAKRAGINKHITSHVGRHTYACYCLRHGVRTEAIQRTLGHRKISTTQIYARLSGMDVVDAFKDLH